MLFEICRIQNCNLWPSNEEDSNNDDNVVLCSGYLNAINKWNHLIVTMRMMLVIVSLQLCVMLWDISMFKIETLSTFGVKYSVLKKKCGLETCRPLNRNFPFLRRFPMPYSNDFSAKWTLLKLLFETDWLMRAWTHCSAYE